MHFVAILKDKPDHMAVRMANRPAHVEWLKANPTVRVAGPFLSEDGQAMTGSMLIIEADSRAGVEALLAEDPYAKAGLFASVVVEPWRWVIGAPTSA